MSRDTKLATALRAISVYNDYDLLKRFGEAENDWVVYYRPADGSMMDPGRLTIAWRFRGPQFTAGTTEARRFFGRRSEGFPRAIAFVESKTGCVMQPSPFGGHVPSRVLNAARKAVGFPMKIQRTTQT